MLLKDIPLPKHGTTRYCEHLEEIPEDEHDWLRNLMIPAQLMCAKGQFKDAYDYIIEQVGQDEVYYRACWSLFDSKQRSAMKRSRNGTI